jgi:ASC-1-like (ASCH) protein
MGNCDEFFQFVTSGNKRVEGTINKNKAMAISEIVII